MDARYNPAISRSEDLEPEDNLPTTAAEVEERMMKYRDHNQIICDSRCNPMCRAMHHWLSTRLCEQLINNTTTAGCAGNVTSKRYFPLFPKLPKELRDLVWGLAFECPRIVELEQVGRWELSYHHVALPMGTSGRTFVVRHKPLHYPPLFHTCRDSRDQALRIYERDRKVNVRNKVPSSRWMRYDYDIFYIKDFGRKGRHISKFMDNIEVVAITWDALLREQFSYSGVEFPLVYDKNHEFEMERLVDILRGYMSLRVLVILINDAVDIQPRFEKLPVADKLHRDFSFYESWERVVQRCRLELDVTGPYKKIEKNTEYEERIKRVVMKSCQGGSSHLKVVPRVVVRSYSLPLDAEMERSRVEDMV